MIYTTTSLYSVGCTFLDWSILFLSGQNSFFNFNKNAILELTQNPLTDINAHQHEKNHPLGFLETVDQINCFKKQDQNNVYSSYFTVGSASKTIKKLNFTKNINEIRDSLLESYANTWKFLQDESIPLIFLDIHDPYYFQNFRSVGRSFIHENKFTFGIDSLKEIYNYFIEDEHKPAKWGNVNSKDQFDFKYVWDFREFLALTHDPYNTLYKKEDLAFFCKFDHYYLNAKELWFDGDDTLIKVLDYLSLPLIESRLQRWLPIYKKWQKGRIKELKLSWNIDHICESIIHGLNFDLTSYNLNLLEESFIQRILIYKYGKNLKTLGLEKFPNNTKQLHELLEPNTHKIIQKPIS